MDPSRKLTALAARKEALQQKIAHGRTRCAVAAARVLRPVAFLDRARALRRRLAPVLQGATVPAMVLLVSALGGGRETGRALGRWTPVVLGAVRLLRVVRRPPDRARVDPA